MDLVFLFKKTVTNFLNPVSITLELVFLGILLIAFSRRIRKNKSTPLKLRSRKRVGRVGFLFVFLGLGWLYLCSTTLFSSWLLAKLESQYPPLPEENGKALVPTEPEFIVVLSGGEMRAKGKPAFSQLTKEGLARIAAASRYWKQFPEASIVLTGRPSETVSMGAAAIEFGVSPEKIIQEKDSKDTKDHPVYLKPILKNSPFLLVTSAVHFPRSYGLFRKQGYDPIPAPVDFVAWPSNEEGNATMPPGIFPYVRNVFHVDLAMHEWIGMTWAKMRGQIE